MSGMRQFLLGFSTVMLPFFPLLHTVQFGRNSPCTAHAEQVGSCAAPSLEGGTYTCYLGLFHLSILLHLCIHL